MLLAVVLQVVTLVLHIGTSIASGKTTSGLQEWTVVEIHTTTVYEVNEAASIPKVFGITAYAGEDDFVSDDGTNFLKGYNIDTVGLGQILGEVLPQASNVTLNRSQLTSWLLGPLAKAQYQASSEYAVLNSRGVRKGGAVPFIFLKNPDGSCYPECEAAHCYPTAGTPTAMNASSPQRRFAWWSTLFVGYFNFCMQADPDIELVHIWNEPNGHFWKDGKNGSYYAEFYNAVATELKKHWPHVKFGGPVTWDPPNGPFLPQSNPYINWAEYTRPLLDSAIPAGVLDFVDFHAYQQDADPESLLSSIQTTNAYSQARYGKPIEVAITESNYKLETPLNKTGHFHNRTFPLVLSTFALLKSPDAVISRLIFDYKSNTSPCNCALVSGPVQHLNCTQDTNIYYALGKLSNGTRLYTNISGKAQHMSRSQCKCFSTSAFENSSVLVEAAKVGGNITVAMVNPCDCPTTVTMSFQESNGTKVSSSWAVLLDADSLREVRPPVWPKDDITLPPLSLLVASYTMSNGPNSHYSSPEVRRQVTVAPMDTESIMQPITTSYHSLTVLFNTSQVSLRKPDTAFLRLSILGDPGQQTWTVAFACETRQMVVDIVSPGVLSVVQLPCVPMVSSKGFTELNFKLVPNSMQHTQRNHSSGGPAYFASAVLALEGNI